MARLAPAPVQQYRGTTAQHAAYTGAAGELTVDTTKKAVVVHDGTTAGGITMAREDRQISVGSGLKIGTGAAATLAADFEIDVDIANLISSKSGNALVAADAAGEDGKLFVAPQDVANLIADDDELLYKNDDGKIASGLDLAYNTTTGKFDITNHAGDIIATVTVPSSVSMLQNAELVVDPTYGDPAVVHTGTFMHFTFKLADGTTSDLYVDVTTLIDVYTNGDGLALSSNQFSVKLGDGLKFDNDKNVAAKYDDMVSAKSGNALAVAGGADEDGKLYVAAQTVVSADADNLAVAGTDGGVLVTCANVKSTTAGNQIQCDSGKLMVVSDYGTMD